MWDELYERFYPELKRYARSACFDDTAAEDAAQEVFMKALQNADTFEALGPSQQRAWLYRSLKNLLCDRYRRARLENDYLDAQIREEAYIDSRMQAVETQLLLATFTDTDRAMFHLRYEEGYNASELAEMFSLPPGTVRSRLSRMRTILKSMLMEE